MDCFEELISGMVERFENATTEQAIIDYLEQAYQPEADMVVEGDFESACRSLLPHAYARGWYALCGWIYGAGFGSEGGYDPLCGGDHPLIFAAKAKKAAFAACYIQHQKRFDYLSYDDIIGQGRVYKTLLERLVEADCPEVMEVCLKNDANPNAFTFDGKHLVQIAPSAKMQALLEEYGGVAADVRETNLVRVVNQMDFLGYVTQVAVDALFSKDPLLEFSWCNGFTPASKVRKADLMCLAAKGCYVNVLERLLPYMRDLSDARRREILIAIVDTDIFGRYLPRFDRPGDVPAALELLYENGFRYPVDGFEKTAPGPMAEVLDKARISFGFSLGFPEKLRDRVFRALHLIGGIPGDANIFKEK